VGRKRFLSASSSSQGRVKHLCWHIILDKFLCDHFARISLLIFFSFPRVSNHHVIHRFFYLFVFHLQPSFALFFRALQLDDAVRFITTDLLGTRSYARALRDRRILFILTISLIVKSRILVNSATPKRLLSTDYCRISK